MRVSPISFIGAVLFSFVSIFNTTRPLLKMSQQELMMAQGSVGYCQSHAYSTDYLNQNAPKKPPQPYRRNGNACKLY